MEFKMSINIYTVWSFLAFMAILIFIGLAGCADTRYVAHYPEAPNALLILDPDDSTSDEVRIYRYRIILDGWREWYKSLQKNH